VDAAVIRAAALQVIRTVAGRQPDIAGIGVTSFGETFVLLDSSDTPLCPAMLYTDPRGSEECAELVESLGLEYIEHTTGLYPHEMYGLPKMMWVKKHHPELFARARYIAQMGDFIVYTLTGEKVIDYSLATRTLAFDIRRLAWDGRILAAAGIDAGLFAEPHPSGSRAGRIRSEIAAETGLHPGTEIIMMSQDQVAAAVGSGVFDSSKAVDGAGTVECITPVFDSIPANDELYKGRYAIVPYIIPGKYVCYAFSYTGGALMQWCIDTLAKAEKAEAEKQGLSVYALLEKRSLDAPTGLLVLPHFAGAATPYMDTAAKGAIVGLTLGSTVEDVFQGCMEGVVYEMMLNTERLNAAGIHFSMLHATGGGASSKLWMQMKADALNVPLKALETPDAGTAGSAMLSGIALGVYSGLEEAARQMVREKEIYYPREAQHEMYLKVYERYRQLYGALYSIIH
jgi:xylulokinase